jgi:hypothetical protein
MMQHKSLEALVIALLGNKLTVDELQAELKGLNPKQRLGLFERLDLMQTPVEEKLTQSH